MNAPCRANPDTPELIAERRATLLAALVDFSYKWHATKPVRHRVDEVKVLRAIQGILPVQLNIVERREVIDYLHFRGMSARLIAQHSGATGRTVERRIQYLRDQRQKQTLRRPRADIDVQNVCDDERSTPPEQRTA